MTEKHVGVLKLLLVPYGRGIGHTGVGSGKLVVGWSADERTGHLLVVGFVDKYGWD